MKVILNNGIEATLHYSKMFAGYGHYKIECLAEINGETKTFKHVTTDLERIDEIKQASKDNEHTQPMYHESYFDAFEERLNEWANEFVPTFGEWLQSDNVIKVDEGYKTQCTQWGKAFTYDEIKKYFQTEFE